MYKLLLIFLVSVFSISCASKSNGDNREHACEFFHQQYSSNSSDVSSITAELHDEWISISRQTIEVCKVAASGYPVDVIWLKSPKNSQIIVVEDSALGSNMNLLDYAKCSVLDSRSFTGDYLVQSDRIVSVLPECDIDKAVDACINETIFQWSDDCTLAPVL